MTQVEAIFSPPPGIFPDDTTVSNGGKWLDCNLVRFWNGKAQVIGGWIKMFATALTGVPRKLFAFDRSGTATMAYGTASKLYVGTGAAQPTDRSPVGLGASIEAWSLQAWGSTLLASPKGGTLYEQSGAATATEVANAPDVINAMLVSSDRRQVIAFGCNEETSGTFNGLCIRWCDFEDYSDWATTATNNAGEFILTGAGQIKAARHIGGVIWIWTDAALWEMSFLGDPGQTYAFRLIDDTSGVAGPDAVEVYAGRAWWIGPDLRVRATAPGEIPRLIPNPVSRYLVDLTGSANRSKIVVSNNSEFGEIWIFVTGAGGTENTHYFGFNIETGHWFRGTLGRSAVLDDGSLAAVLGSTSAKSSIIMAASNGFVYVHEHGYTADGASLNWGLTSGAWFIGKGGRRVMLHTVRPDISNLDGDTITLQVRSADYPAVFNDGGYRATNATISGFNKKNFRASGKFFSFDLSGSKSGNRLGSLAFNGALMGER